VPCVQRNGRRQRSQQLLGSLIDCIRGVHPTAMVGNGQGAGEVSTRQHRADLPIQHDISPQRVEF